jgi:hypothetical protein
MANISMDEKIGLYDKLVAAHANAIRKGAMIPYTSLNGHMYSYFSKDGFLALRLPADVREKFLAKYRTTLATAYGLIQKEYVVVPDSLLRKTKELKFYFDLSYEYAGSLKPKTSKSKKKS